MPYIPPYSQQLWKNLQAQIHLAPELLAANAETQPGYTALNLQNLDQFLNGTEGSSMPAYAWEAPVYSNPHGGKSGGGMFSGPGGLPMMPGGDGGFGLPGMGGGGGFGLPGMDGGFGLPGMGGGGDGGFGLPGLDGLFGGSDKPKKKLLSKGRWVQSGTHTMGPQRGFLDLYSQDIMPALYKERSAGRSADINDVSTLGPEMREALRNSNPDAAQLLDQLYGSATDDLSRGAQLNDSESRNISQAIRGGQSARGMGVGPNDNFQEALASLDYGRGLQDNRRGFAAGTLGLLNNFYGDPFQRVLGRSDPNSGLGIASGALGGSKQESQFNPESSYAGSIFNTIFNANLAEGLAAKNNRAALTAAGINAAGNIIGGAAGMI